MTPEARINLVIDNLKLVAHIAREFNKSPELTEELVDEGYIGLVEASTLYDESKGKFQSYAGTIVRNKMRKYLLREPKNQFSFDSITGTDGLPLSDTLPDSAYLNAEDRIVKQEILATLKVGMSRLGPREAWILRRYYGFDDCEPLTMQEIGDYIGVSKQYVNQLIKESLEFLRNYLKKA